MKLTQDQKNQRLCEWAIAHGVDVGALHDGTGRTLFESLDAVHEVIGKLTDEQYWPAYYDALNRSSGSSYDVRTLTEATAAQRAEALGLTLGLWKEGE